jgi:hypothetical protein
MNRRNRGGVGLGVMTALCALLTADRALAQDSLFVSGRSFAAVGNFGQDLGFAPGRTDLRVFLGPDARTTFSGVPPGTYYLRLRGGNDIGGGRASAETVLVVR